jgi:AraC-like DNA-binding protein
MMRSMQEMQADGQMTDDDGLRNGLLRLQLTTTLLRMSVWQAPGTDETAMDAAGLLRYRRFQKMLETDFTKSHQVQHYASALGMSEKTLSRLCVAAAGVPAKTVISQRLMLEAKRLLAHTSTAVQDIGHELGFEEATNFVKFFRKEAGTTPMEFRKGVYNSASARPLAQAAD